MAKRLLKLTKIHKDGKKLLKLKKARKDGNKHLKLSRTCKRLILKVTQDGKNDELSKKRQLPWTNTNTNLIENSLTK